MNATKKFNQLSTKKLNALLAAANESDKAKIIAVLEGRKQTAKKMAALEARKQIANNSEEMRVICAISNAIALVQTYGHLTPTENNTHFLAITPLI